MENTIENKHPFDGITLPLSKFEVRENFSSIDVNSKSKDEDSIEVNCKDELISALEYLKKSRKGNEVPKEQLEKEEEQVKKSKDMYEALEKQMNVREEELLCTK